MILRISFTHFSNYLWPQNNFFISTFPARENWSGYTTDMNLDWGAVGLGNLTRQKMFGQFCNFSFKNVIPPLAWLDKRPAAALPSSSQTQGSSSARAVMENGKNEILDVDWPQLDSHVWLLVVGFIHWPLKIFKFSFFCSPVVQRLVNH